MKKIINNIITVSIAIIGLIGGSIWGVKSNWDYEPLILLSVSFLEIIGFFIIKDESEEIQSQNSSSINNSNNVTVNINNEKKLNKEELKVDNITKKVASQIRILFIDDNHTDFKMVSILKKAGYTNTKSIKDIIDLSDPKIVEADVIFVDINGVGVSMFEDQGLGLASALKKKYSPKKIILYSAENKGDRFHSALREVDSCLPKNAEPYQFISLIESFNYN